MSRLLEYIDLVKRGIPNIDKIAESLLNQVKEELGTLPEDQLQEVTRRRLICDSCPIMSLNIVKDNTEYKKLFNKEFDFDSSRGKYCGSCGCGCKNRTSSLDSNCGLEYYNEQNPDNKQDLKWTKYETIQ